MNLERHISALLYNHDCVIVPGFGAFLTHKNPSMFKDGVIYPPSKHLGFNTVLQKSDGLLIQSVAERNHLSFEEAKLEVENRVSFWKNHLENNDSLVLSTLGTFSKNTSGNLEFRPDSRNYLLDAFGLESVRIKHIMQPVSRDDSSGFGWWKVAAVVPILIGGYLYFGKPQPVADFVNEQWSGFVSPILNSESSTEEIPTVAVEVVETPVIKVEENNLTHDYQVIAGAFRLMSEAETMEQKLREQGYEKARFTQKKGNYFYVAFETFPTKEEALEYRKTVRESFPETWVLSLKED